MPHGDAHDHAFGVQHGEARELAAAEQLLNDLSLRRQRDALNRALLLQDVLHAQGLGYVLGPAVWQKGKGSHIDELVVETVVDAVAEDDRHEGRHPCWCYHHGVPGDLDHHDGDGQGDPRASSQEGSGASKGPNARVDPANGRQRHAVGKRPAHGRKERCPLLRPEAVLRSSARVQPQPSLKAYEQDCQQSAEHGADDDHRQEQPRGNC
mmetsp:Transcript_7901/g.22394  ORF Transcript_7901/g.22394 Transcript_7901/m.22394 type:complete len:209 (-) Transcript_7901:298-924(-)